MLFIDTSTADGYIETKDDREDASISNEGEALLVEELVKKYVEMGISPGDIGIITPVSISHISYVQPRSYLYDFDGFWSFLTFVSFCSIGLK